MSKDYILTVLRDLMSEYLKEPRWGIRRKHFEMRSIQQWAVEEILYQIRCSDLPPENTLEEFIGNCYRCSKYKKETKIIFETAMEIGEIMYDILEAMY